MCPNRQLTTEALDSLFIGELFADGMSASNRFSWIEKPAYDQKEAQEGTDPLVAQEAWRIQAKSYFSSGFVTKDAIDPDGFLVPELDKARGKNTTYYVASKPGKPEDRATLRLFNLEPGQDCTNLPSFEMCQAGLTDEGRKFLRDIPNPNQSLKEIAGLAKTGSVDPRGIYELLRTVVWETQGKHEVIFCSGVSSTLGMLIKKFGKTNFQIIGDPIHIDDPRVLPDISLIPAIIKPDDFLTNIYNEYKMTDKGDAQTKKRLAKSFMFLTYGLPNSEKTEEILEYRNLILGEIAISSKD